MAKTLRYIGIILYIIINYLIAGYFLGITAPYRGLIVLYIFGLFSLSGCIISLAFSDTNFRKILSYHLSFQIIINAVTALIALQSADYSASVYISGILYSLVGGLIFSILGIVFAKGLITATRAVRKSSTKG